MKKFFIFIFILSCTPNNLNSNKDAAEFNFNQNLTFNDFKSLILKYSELAPYPNIDN